MDQEEVRALNERLDYIEFRQELLFDNDDVSRFVFECKFTRVQYQRIMDLMDEYREKIDKGKNVDCALFEMKMKEISPDAGADYHTSEILTKLFMENGRWEEVYPALYGDLPK